MVVTFTFTFTFTLKITSVSYFALTEEFYKLEKQQWQMMNSLAAEKLLGNCSDKEVVKVMPKEVMEIVGGES